MHQPTHITRPAAWKLALRVAAAQLSARLVLTLLAAGRLFRDIRRTGAHSPSSR